MSEGRGITRRKTTKGSQRTLRPLLVFRGESGGSAGGLGGELRLVDRQNARLVAERDLELEAAARLHHLALEARARAVVGLLGELEVVGPADRLLEHHLVAGALALEGGDQRGD